MIKNFYNFNINEGYLTCSNTFLDIIASIRDNKVGNILYKLFSNGDFFEDLSQNFISVFPDDDGDKITFLSDKKSTTINDVWNNSSRNPVKIGRMVNALLSRADIKEYLSKTTYGINFSFNQKDIEDFVNRYKACVSKSNGSFEIISGDEIKKWYNEKNYNSDKGTLGGSCMRDVPSKFFNLYSENEKVCRMLILKNEDDKLLGRALVWKLSKSPSTATYFMDRIYCERDFDTNRFIEYAKENKWMYKVNQRSDAESSICFIYEDEYFLGEIKVKIKAVSFKSFPFLDTMPHINENKTEISNVGYINGRTLDDTDGSCEKCYCKGKGKSDCVCKKGLVDCSYCKDVECENCNGIGNIDCDTCYSAGYKNCTECDGNGTISNGRGKKRTTCEHCKGEGYFKCEHCKGKGTFKCLDCNKGIIKSKPDCKECGGKKKLLCDSCGGAANCTDCIDVIYSECLGIIQYTRIPKLKELAEAYVMEYRKKNKIDSFNKES